MPKNLTEKIFDWCVNEYGLSKYQEYIPWLEIEDDNLGMMGEYESEENTITIYENYIKNTDELVETMIHEYQHYLQSPVWMERYYTMGHTHSTHPYEIQAEEVAQRDKNKCKKFVNNA